MSGTGKADELSHKGRKDSQRERLLEAMTEVSAAQGYGLATIADVISAAHVSRATFYEYFSEKDECFREALVLHLARLIGHIREELVSRSGLPATHGAISGLLNFASSSPAAAQLLIHEALAGGSTAGLYDEMLDQIVDVIEALEISSRHPQTDFLVPVRLLLAAICQTIWPSLHNGETAADLLSTDLTKWVDAYRLDTAATEPIGTLPANLPSSGFLPNPPLRAPSPLSPGRKSLPSGEVTRNRRERILYATAKVAASRGYLAMTVDDLIADAQIAKRVFYQHFRDKDDAYTQATEFFAQPLLATAATAFFSTQPWTERVWETGLALLGFLSSYPEIAHITLIDSYVASEQVRRSIEATNRALALLLEEGYQLCGDEAPPRMTSELVIAACSGLANHYLRHGQGRRLPEHLPSFAAIVLTPFIGAKATSDLLATKIPSA